MAMSGERIMQFRGLIGSLIAGLVVVCGCGETRSFKQPKEHASSELLNSSAPTPKITPQQAADVQVAVGHTLEESNKPKEAEGAYRDALGKDPKRADAIERLAVLSDMKGDFKSSDQLFTRALQLEPKNADFICDRGYSYYLQRRWSDAETAFHAAIKADPTHSRSHNNLGLVYARQGSLTNALEEFRLAGCSASDCQSNLALVLAMDGQIQDARLAYSAALSANPQSKTASDGVRATTAVLTKTQNKANGSRVAAAPVLATPRPRTNSSGSLTQTPSTASPRADAGVRQTSATVPPPAPANP
jgi:tetratricopeptide (TPR) repeat protein